jgi:hypothetical protein
VWLWLWLQDKTMRPVSSFAKGEEDGGLDNYFTLAIHLTPARMRYLSRPRRTAKSQARNAMPHPRDPRASPPRSQRRLTSPFLPRFCKAATKAP